MGAAGGGIYPKGGISKGFLLLRVSHTKGNTAPEPPAQDPITVALRKGK